MHVFSEISPTFEFFSFGHRPKFCVKFKNLQCQRLSTLFFAANLQSNSMAAPWLPWGRRTYTNAHACTHTHTHAHGYICMVHLYAHLPGICKCLILSLFAYPSNSSLPLSLSLFHCTLIARLISLSDFALWIPLYAHLAQHRPKCHKHTHGHTVGQPQSAPPLAYWLLRARA